MSNGDSVITILLMLLFGVLYISPIVAVILYLKSRAKRKEAIKKEKEKEAEKYSAYISGIVKHSGGLPMAKGIMINFFMSNEKLTFVKDNQEISLDRSKILNADLVSGKNAKQEVMMGAMAGSMVVDPLYGAIYGSMLAKHKYLVITYKKDDEVRFISLDTENSDLYFQRIINDLKVCSSEEQGKIEL